VIERIWPEKLEAVPGGLAVDDRGSLSYVNDFDMSLFTRFYIVKNHSKGFIRAWHGHRFEAKGVMAVQGSALVAGVKVDNWDAPSTTLPQERFVLSSSKPSVLIIPPGYANGFKSLSDDLILMFFSSSTLEESGKDDIRFASKTWNPWDIEER
jgi:dTDP-4-dehydrorhamnose 3,5-epimerase-like enzyme